MVPESKFPRNDGYARVILALLVAFSGALAIGLVWAPTHQDKRTSIYDLGYWVGPTTHSLLEGRGLFVCDEKMGPPGDPLCFHSARMPVASTTLAAGVMLFGDRPRAINIAKALLFLIPLWGAMRLVLRFACGDRITTTLCGVLLLLPLLVLNLLVVMTSMEVEEGYTYGLLSLALVLVLLPLQRSLSWTLILAMVLGVIFLSKSSMLPAVGVLLVAQLFLLSSSRLRGIAILLVALAPISWILYQHHASGRYSVGTSIDGMNLHKGNNPAFQKRYPSANSTFDSFDIELNGGNTFRNEWDFNDYHMNAGKQFALSHPAFTARSFGRKISYLLFSFNPYVATSMDNVSRIVTLLGIGIFRLLLWSSLLLALFSAGTGRGAGRFAGLAYLCFVGAYCLPYLVGFGFMRHAVVLAYPSAIFCCLVVTARQRDAPMREHTDLVSGGSGCQEPIV